MKSHTTELRNHLINEKQYRRAELWTFTLVDGTVVRYTTLDIPVTINGVTWAANGPVLTRPRSRVAVGVEASEFEVTVNPGADDRIAGMAWSRAARLGLLRQGRLLIERVYMPTWGDVSFGKTYLMGGRMATTAGSDFEIRIIVKSELELLNVNVPVDVVQPTCRNTLFDSGCKLSRMAHAVYSAVASGSTVSAINCGLAESAGHYALGRVLFNRYLDIPSTAGNCATTPNNIAMEPAQNWMPQSEDLAAWTDVSACAVNPNAFPDPNGDMTIDTLTDDSAANYEGRRWVVTVPNDALSYQFAFLVRKDFVSTHRAGVNLSLNGGTVVSLSMRFALDGTNLAGCTVASFDADYWLVSGSISNNNTGNTSLTITFYPATAATRNGADNVAGTGSTSFGWIRLQRSNVLLPYHKTTGVANKGKMLIVARLADRNWIAGTVRDFFAKGTTAGGGRSWICRFSTANRPAFLFTFDGTNFLAATATATPTFPANNQPLLLKIERDGNTGNVTFSTGIDGVVWNQLGSVVATTAGTIWNSTGPLQTGATSAYWDGAIMFATAFDGTDGRVLADCNPERDGITGALSFDSATSGERWTLTLVGSPACSVRGPGLSRSIKYSAPGVLTLAVPLPAVPAVDDIITVWPGCDRLEATCNTKFSNRPNFRGEPRVPQPETAL